MSNSTEDLMCMVEEKIKFGDELMVQLQSVKNIDGVMKLQRKIRQEIEFLKRVCTSVTYLVKSIITSQLYKL